MYGIHFYSHPS